MTTFVEKSQPVDREIGGEYIRDDFRNGIALDISVVANFATRVAADATEWLAKCDERSLPTCMDELKEMEKTLRHALAIVHATTSRTSDYLTGKSRL
jgi:hypothetical protein